MTALDERRSARGVADGRPAGLSPLTALAVAFTLLYAGIHVYWALGGTWGVPLAARQDPDTLRAANWVVTVIMLIGAAWLLAMDHRVARRVPAWTVLVPVWGGAVICLSHAVFGFVTKALYLTGAHGAVDFPEATGVDAATLARDHHTAAVRDLWLFEPCFLVQGALLALAGRAFARTPAGRRAWTLSLLAGVVVIDVFGLLLALTGRHVALG
ncbi:DUF3995 domain-containing protein [Streptomyces sp. SID5785]|uniref:DUF3995 domain-containing protein n=1 Tax=Streptomyces sp. SID5785 TaxID=2690309 RepID=UPI001361A519|nr:DUF3995 domain-containing protein [Streptomyces sp. SID5785]MZD07413.1 DUF3995 domain-containing protein [Streptomyces sp. SID5785]